MNNLAHPALAGLVVDFFYTDPNAVSILFPKVFASEVPHAAVMLAATAIFSHPLTHMFSCTDIHLDQACSQ